MHEMRPSLRLSLRRGAGGWRSPCYALRTDSSSSFLISRAICSFKEVRALLAQTRTDCFLWFLRVSSGTTKDCRWTEVGPVQPPVNMLREIASKKPFWLPNSSRSALPSELHSRPFVPFVKSGAISATKSANLPNCLETETMRLSSILNNAPSPFPPKLKGDPKTLDKNQRSRDPDFSTSSAKIGKTIPGYCWKISVASLRNNISLASRLFRAASISAAAINRASDFPNFRSLRSLPA